MGEGFPILIRNKFSFQLLCMMSYNQQMVLNSSKFSNLLFIPLACLDVKSTAVVLPLSAVDNAAFSPNRLAGLLDSMNPSYLMKKDASWYLHFKRVILLTFPGTIKTLPS